jgi:hypothetical protein
MKKSTGKYFGVVCIALVFLLLAIQGIGNQVSAAPIGSASLLKSAPVSPPPPDVLPAVEKTLTDTDGSLKAKEKRVLTGDDFYKGLFERPFSSGEMVYQEDADIRIVTYAHNDVFHFFTIELHGLDPVTKSLTGTYGIEFDRSKTGHGDFLVWVKDAKKEWSMEGVKAFSNPSKTVGGPTPLWVDKGYSEGGYEKEEKLEGDRVAYARIDPKDATILQIAVNTALLDNAEEFLWGAWADKGWQDPMRFDYNDHIEEVAAGSPIKTSSYYPLKELANLDNTCRLTAGFTTTDIIRGKCDEKVCKIVTKCFLNQNRVKVCTYTTVCS